MSQITDTQGQHSGSGVISRKNKFTDLLRFEWTKLRTLNSTTYAVISVFVLVVGLGALMPGGAAEDYRTAEEQAAFDPVGSIVSIPVVIGLLAVAVLGALIITGEYATGMIRPTLAAVPHRARLLAAKAVVLGAVLLAVGLVSALTLFFVSQPMLRAEGLPDAGLGDTSVLLALVGVALYITLVGLLALAVGTLVRATAGAISIVIAFVVLLPQLLPGMVPERLGDFVQDYWPTRAGLSVMFQEGMPDAALGVWDGFAVMAAFVALVLAVAFVAFQRRDA